MSFVDRISHEILIDGVGFADQMFGNEEGQRAQHYDAQHWDPNIFKGKAVEHVEPDEKQHHGDASCNQVAGGIALARVINRFAVTNQGGTSFFPKIRVAQVSWSTMR